MHLCSRGTYEHFQQSATVMAWRMSFPYQEEQQLSWDDDEEQARVREKEVKENITTKKKSTE